jgi:hypothetical protein
MNLAGRFRFDLPVAVLIAANILPIFGVLFLKWDVFSIVVLYWMENLVIGFYNILMIILAASPKIKNNLGKLFDIPLFIIHYGAYTGVQGFFILFIDKGLNGIETASFMGHAWPVFLAPIQSIYNVDQYLWIIIQLQIKLTVLVLLVSHGVSFIHHYLIGGEYKRVIPEELMFRPYSMVLVMQMVVLFGFFLFTANSQATHSPAALAIVLVVAKTIIDGLSHARFRIKTGPRVRPTEG